MGSGDTVHLQCVPPRAQPEATVRFLKDGQPFIDSNGLTAAFHQPKPFSHSSSHPSTSINNDEARTADGFLFPLADAERFKLLSDGTLRIHNAQPKDNGRYSCVAENFVDTRESAPALLTVFGKFITFHLTFLMSFIQPLWASVGNLHDFVLRYFFKYLGGFLEPKVALSKYLEFGSINYHLWSHLIFKIVTVFTSDSAEAFLTQKFWLRTDKTVEASESPE